MLIFYLLTVRKGSLQISIAQNITNLYIDTGNCLINIRDTDGSYLGLDYDTLKALSSYIDHNAT